jgi:hypothetical protein
VPTGGGVYRGRRPVLPGPSTHPSGSTDRKTPTVRELERERERIRGRSRFGDWWLTGGAKPRRHSTLNEHTRRVRRWWEWTYQNLVSQPTTPTLRGAIAYRRALLQRNALGAGAAADWNRTVRDGTGLAHGSNRRDVVGRSRLDHRRRGASTSRG